MRKKQSKHYGLNIESIYGDEVMHIGAYMKRRSACRICSDRLNIFPDMNSFQVCPKCINLYNLDKILGDNPDQDNWGKSGYQNFTTGVQINHKTIETRKLTTQAIYSVESVIMNIVMRERIKMGKNSYCTKCFSHIKACTCKENLDLDKISF